MIELDVKIDGVEYIKLNYRLVYSNPALLIIFSGVVAIVLGSIFTGRLDFTNLLTSPIPSLGLLVIFYLVLILPVSLFYRARYFYNNHAALHERVQYSINEKGLTQKGETFTEKFVWKDFLVVRQTDKWLLLLKGRSAGVFIPKSAFKKEEDLDFLLQMAKENKLIRN